MLHMGKRKGLATQKQVPFISILNFIRKPFFISPCCFEQFLYDDIYISIYKELGNFLCINQIVTINLFAESAKIITYFSNYRIPSTANFSPNLSIICKNSYLLYMSLSSTSSTILYYSFHL